MANAQLERQYRLVETGSRETADVFIFDIENMISTPVKVNGIMLTEEKAIARSYDATWEYYINRYVHPKDKERLKEAVQMENLVRNLDLEGEQLLPCIRYIEKPELMIFKGKKKKRRLQPEWMAIWRNQ